MRRRYSRDLTGVDLADPRHPARRDGDQPAGRALRPAGDPPRLGDLRRRPAISVRLRHLRRARRGRLRRRGARPAQPADHPRDDRGGGARDPRRRRASLLARRRPFLTWPLLKAHAEKYGPLALVQFDAHQDTWADDGKKLSHGTFVARAVREGIVNPARSIQIGVRTHAPEDCGIEVLSAYDVHRLTPDGGGAAHPRAGRRHAGLSDLRHRLPRPGLRARHRHAGRRRAVLRAGADGARRASATSISSAATWWRSRRPTTMPTSRRSPPRRWRSTISGCWR